MFGAEEVKATFSDEEMDVYRNGFPVWFPEDAQCVLWEKDEDLFVRVFRTNAAENLPLFAENVFVLDEDLELGYAITIHKSQGSEFPAAVVLLQNQHFLMLQRNLLYTAMTRAKKLLILIGSRRAVEIAVHNTRIRPRYSLLAKRLAAKRSHK